MTDIDVPHTPDDRGSAEPKRRKPRDKPLLIVVTGHGKGKSTSAFGMLLRAWARGYRCGVFQFVKSGKWKVGEAKAAQALGGIDWEKMGDGWTWISRDLEESADKAREGWAEVKRRIEAERYEFLLLDELTYAIKYGWISEEEIVATLKQPAGLPAHRRHRPRRLPRADRGRRPRQRGRQDQAPDGTGHPRAAGDRVVIPRIVIAGTSCGAGKTTVATGIDGRARRTSPRSRSARTSSTPATTRSRPAGPGRNLDAFLSAPGADRAAGPARLARRRHRRDRGRDGPVRRRVRPRRAGVHRARREAAAGAGRARGRRGGDGALGRGDRPRLPHVRPRRERRGRDPQPGRLRRPRATSCARRCRTSPCSARCTATPRSRCPSATSASSRWPSASRARAA